MLENYVARHFELNKHIQLHFTIFFYIDNQPADYLDGFTFFYPQDEAEYTRQKPPYSYWLFNRYFNGIILPKTVKTITDLKVFFQDIFPAMLSISDNCAPELQLYEAQKKFIAAAPMMRYMPHNPCIKYRFANIRHQCKIVDVIVNKCWVEDAIQINFVVKFEVPKLKYSFNAKQTVQITNFAHNAFKSKRHFLRKLIAELDVPDWSMWGWGSDLSEIMLKLAERKWVIENINEILTTPMYSTSTQKAVFAGWQPWDRQNDVEEFNNFFRNSSIRIQYESDFDCAGFEVPPFEIHNYTSMDYPWYYPPKFFKRYFDKNPHILAIFDDFFPNK